MRGQEVLHPLHPIRGLLSPLKLPSSGCLAPLLIRPRSNPLQGSSRVSVVHQKRDDAKYIAIRSRLSMMEPSYICIVHLTSIVIPSSTQSPEAEWSAGEFVPLTPATISSCLKSAVNDRSEHGDVYKEMKELVFPYSSIQFSLRLAIRINNGMGMGVVTTFCALPPVSLASTSTGPRDEESEKASLLPTKDRGSGAVWSPLLYLFFGCS